jgi:hypothetical protein
MKLLNTYEDPDDARDAVEKLVGNKRLASERDDTTTIYNLFGIASWGNFLRLDMYNLKELRELLSRRNNWQPSDKARHLEILISLQNVSKNYEIILPNHWE